MHIAINRDRLWESVMRRDREVADQFVYAVRTTGVYCRPSCPSRRPRRESVEFFEGPDSAELAGYRACRRCHPRQGRPMPAGLEPVKRACAYIAKHVDRPIRLPDLAAHVAVSPFHLQRRFVELVGLSPRVYQDALRAKRFRGELRRGADVSAAVYDAGYGSISRVYEHGPTGRGMTPGVYRAGGGGQKIGYTVIDSVLGRLLLAGTSKGVCAVMIGDRDRQLEDHLRTEYPDATLVRKPNGLARWARAVTAHLDGRRPHLDLPIDVRATAFQWKVWRHLQSIPYGTTRTYGEVAKGIGAPSSVRAVGRACATNPVCLVIPCHRVKRKGGGLGGYRWGVARKKELLRRESN